MVWIWHVHSKVIWTMIPLRSVDGLVRTYCHVHHSGLDEKWYPFTKLHSVTTQKNTLCSYTGCPGGNVPDFGRMFLKLKYTDITKNTCIRSWTDTEIKAREKCGLLAVYLVRVTYYPYAAHVRPCLQSAQARSHCDCSCKVLGILRTTMTLVWVFM